MLVKDFFQQDINRPIETVIKADDQEHILQEVTEYVITKEIAKKVRDFFGAYNNYQGANGVWISGFFGSGKSHLLKILSYVLENKELNGYKLGELFAEKVEEDAMLKGDILKAARIPSESVLFNIDQQAQITSKQDQDAILTVFYKVFNDHLGYFGSQRHVADFERWLDEEGVYKEFRSLFESVTGAAWVKERRKYFSPKVKKGIASVLSSIFKDDEGKYENIIDTLRKDNVISIEDFSQKVKIYIDTKPKDFHLNFFVDEVGQYISDNTKLMLNLQTIAESLATKTKGKAWILVTSQEDMETIVGDMNSRQQNDFSRIQARFENKIPLTSANVDEVIEKRLLSKSEEASNVLNQNWKDEKANLETLLRFTDGGVQFKGYTNEKDFCNKFPFVPYQFDLFQQCIKTLSKHNAFQGKHASVGERSMLGVFQDVICKLGNKDQRKLVSFEMMFEGIRSSIKGEIQSAITLAEKNIDNNFALRVLKALFLVKYYTNFRTTSRNISVLLLDDMDVDLQLHEKKIKEALELLELQSYLNRNGEIYEYLTDDEKDIEEEIKSTEIDSQQVNQTLNEILFDDIIRDTKIRFTDNKQDYEYTRKIDGIVFGREKELTVEIITPNNENYGQEAFYKAQTMGYNTLMVMVLPQNERLMKDIRLWLKTTKYIKQNQSSSNKENVKRILYDKGQQNLERREALKLLLKKMLGEALVYLNGSNQEAGIVADGRNKLHNCFQDLIKLAYPSLKMLGDANYNEDSIKRIIKSKDNDLFGKTEGSLSEAESEMLNLINRRKKQSDRTNISDLLEYFARKPYGWYTNGVLAIIARLYKHAKIEVRRDASLLNDDELLNNLLNTRNHSTTLLTPQEVIDPKAVRKLKEIYNETFDEACPAMEAREVANAFKNRLEKEIQEIAQLFANRNQYPFLNQLDGVKKFLQKLQQKEYSYFLNKRSEFEDDLLDQKEDLLDPVKKFWNGEQKNIFDNIRTFITGNQSNLDYIDGDEMSLLNGVFKSDSPFKGDQIKKAKTAMDALKQKLISTISKEKEIALSAIQEMRQNMEQHADFAKLKAEQQKQLLQPFDLNIEKLSEQRYIANIKQTATMVREELYNDQLNKMVAMAQPPEKSVSKPYAGGNGTKKVVKDYPYEKPCIQYINKNNVKVPFSKTELQTEADVKEYLKAVEEELLKQIKQNRRISLT
jgi:hypothetical protein